MSDATTITIDALNMVNGSTMTATNDDWYISYGTNANDVVAVNNADNTIKNQQPFYFGQVLARGSEFRWNLNVVNQQRWGIWDGAQVASTYQVATDINNWNTCFNFLNGGTRFINGTNTALITGTQYVLSAGDPVGIKFDEDGHLTLIDYSGTTPVDIAKTTIPLSVTEFNLQYGTWQYQVFPNGIISTSDWTIVHDFAGTEAGIVNGILDHTVLKSNLSILPGEKIMFMLDEVGQGDRFGTNYTSASTGVSTAEEQLDNEFIYQTNEAIVLDPSVGVSDWNANTSASGYFYSANLNQYRAGGNAGTIQGMHSLRYLADNSIEIYDEDANEVIATAKQDGDGSAISLYFGVRGNRAYYSIPVISKQSVGSLSQPELTFAPDISDQAFSITEGAAFSLQIALDAGSDIVNMYGESDAPSWAVLGQTSGQFIGTAPAFNGTSDSYVINCKAGNAIGGIVNFTVTLNVAEIVYTNSKSLKFSANSNAYLAGPHATANSMARSGNGSGSADAWSLSMWVKPSSSTNVQTLFYYGGDDLTNEGRIEVQQFSGNNVMFKYGSANNYLYFIGVGNFPTNQWNHILVTYNGGATGVNQADISTYLTNFTFSVNGANGASQVQHGNYGYAGSIIADRFRIGRLGGGTSTQYISDGIINQVAIWGTDESANLATIYNSGATQDLSLLTSAPLHYYEIETSVTTVPDLIGTADLTGFNFATSDLVTDAP